MTEKEEKETDDGQKPSLIIPGPVIRIGSLVFTIVCLVAAFYALGYVMNEMKPVCNQIKDKTLSDVPIYSTEDGTAVEGSFFLCSGYIDTYLVYFFYTGDDTNGFQRQMQRAEQTYIFRDSEIPHMVTKIKYKMTPVTPVSMCAPITVYEIHVPRNTLIEDVKTSSQE
jgi:hypothetical protein